jgi:hypothetical protein
MEALIWNAKARCRVYSYRYDYYDTDWYSGKITHRVGEFSVNVGVGYEKRNFDFDTKLIKQWSPSGHNDIYYYEGDGSVSDTYNVTYSIPFLMVGVAQRSGKFNVDMDFGFSTLVHVEDHDVHLLRVPGPMYNDGHLSGNALKFVTHIQYDLTPHVFMGLAADYLYLRTKGTQHQHIDAGAGVVDGTPVVWDEYNYSLKEEVKAQESIFSFNIGFRFGK